MQTVTNNKNTYNNCILDKQNSVQVYNTQTIDESSLLSHRCTANSFHSDSIWKKCKVKEHIDLSADLC